MNTRLFVISMVGAVLIGHSSLAEEYSDDEMYEDAPVGQDAGLLDRDNWGEDEIADAGKSYVILYNRKDFKGYSRKIFLRDGSRIDLHRCSRLHDNVRSMKISAPSHASVVLLEKALATYANQKMAVWWGKGTHREWEVNKRDLNGYKMFRQTSALKFLFDGYWWSSKVQYITC
tara:strand:- start:16305 stop:16826 length:522 start_codon:yes stop_codon:yes gene_type:complete